MKAKMTKSKAFKLFLLVMVAASALLSEVAEAAKAGRNGGGDVDNNGPVVVRRRPDKEAHQRHGKSKSKQFRGWLCAPHCTWKSLIASSSTNPGLIWM